MTISGRKGRVGLPGAAGTIMSAIRSKLTASKTSGMEHMAAASAKARQAA